ncbi:MAG: NAD(P)-binding domain-containing protein [Patescibacteria group bacterium]
MQIAVIGLGRIGSQLLRELVARFPGTIGVDLDPGVVERLRGEGLPAANDPARAAGADVILVAVSTGPRMEKLLAAAEDLRPAPGGLVSVESTIIPGTMAKVASLFTARGCTVGTDVHLVHAPHRILFGVDKSIFGQKRVIGGITPACLARGVEFYRPLVPEVKACASIHLVELCKLVENTLRYMEIACAEALALYCHEAGLDFDELRELVATKGNVRLMRAEYGIGGECLTKDTRFLYELTGCSMLADAMAIDEEYRNWLLREAKAPRVLLRGLTFKRDWRDLGHSRAVELARRLQDAGCEVFVDDHLYEPSELEELGFVPWHPGQEVDTAVVWGKISKRGGV